MASLTTQCLPFWQLAPEPVQQRLVADALAFTTGSELAPSREERILLTCFAQGELSFAQLVERLQAV